MKVLRVPLKEGGDVWIVTHDLTLFDGRYRKLRPIHVLTFVASHRCVADKATRTYALSMALENKLAAVGVHHKALRQAIAAFGDPVYVGQYVREYSEQAIIAPLEAYLASIYTCLELTSAINKTFYPTLPIGFRRQSKKFAAFDFAKHDWLAQFYDIRTELTHFGTTLPSLEDANLVIEFTNPKQLEHFKAGKYAIGMLWILDFYKLLVGMLDAWAIDELAHLDPTVQVQCVKETGVSTAPSVEMITVADLLALLK